MIRILFSLIFVLSVYSETVEVHAAEENTENYSLQKLPPIQTSVKFNIEEFKSNEGINIIYSYLNDAKAVSIRYVFKNANHLIEKKPGICQCLIKLMGLSNSKKYTYEELKKLADLNSIDCSISNESDDVSGFIFFPTKRADNVVTILTETLYNLNLEDEKFELARQRLLQTYNLNSSHPSYILDTETAKAMFPDHMYGYTITDADLKNLTLDDIKEAYKSSFAKDSLKVVVVGNISKEECVKLVDDIFGRLPEKSEPLTLTKIQAKNFKNLELTKEGYKTNKIKFILNKAPCVTDKDYLPIILALQIFSKIPLDNRLINKLRTETGNVYSAGFSLRISELSSYFIGSTESTNKDIVIQSIKELVKSFQENGITEDELALAKNRIKANRIFSSLTSKDISSVVMSNWLNGKDINYLNEKFQIIDSIKLEDVNAAIKKYFSVDNLSISVISGI